MKLIHHKPWRDCLSLMAYNILAVVNVIVWYINFGWVPALMIGLTLVSWGTMQGIVLGRFDEAEQQHFNDIEG